MDSCSSPCINSTHSDVVLLLFGVWERVKPVWVLDELVWAVSPFVTLSLVAVVVGTKRQLTCDWEHKHMMTPTWSCDHHMIKIMWWHGVSYTTLLTDLPLVFERRWWNSPRETLLSVSVRVLWQLLKDCNDTDCTAHTTYIAQHTHSIAHNITYNTHTA